MTSCASSLSPAACAVTVAGLHGATASPPQARQSSPSSVPATLCSQPASISAVAASCQLVAASRQDSRGVVRRRDCAVVVVRAAAPEGDSSPEPATAPPARAAASIVCNDCDGNGAIACRQCKGGGLNLQDHFDGRFKTGQSCWLCRGKRQVLCGCCNGAGFVGGFLSTQDD